MTLQLGFPSLRIPEDVELSSILTWAWQDLNLQPIGYEPTALTN